MRPKKRGEKVLKIALIIDLQTSFGFFYWGLMIDLKNHHSRNLGVYFEGTLYICL